MRDSKQHYSRPGYSSWFVLLVALFITCLVTANVIAVKLVDIFGLTVPAAVIIFPVSYILGDVLTEVYGYARARRVIWAGFAGLAFASVMAAVQDSPYVRTAGNQVASR